MRQWGVKFEKGEGKRRWGKKGGGRGKEKEKGGNGLC